jgi:hypothetical protein
MAVQSQHRRKVGKKLHLHKYLGLVVHTCCLSCTGNINSRITVQNGLSKKQDPMSKITKAKWSGAWLKASARSWIQSPAFPTNTHAILWKGSLADWNLFICHIFGNTLIVIVNVVLFNKVILWVLAYLFLRPWNFFL